MEKYLRNYHLELSAFLATFALNFIYSFASTSIIASEETEAYLAVLESLA